jgi:hypothetical protein
MSAKKRQTFEKMNRERAVREKRARKQEKKEQRKLARAAMNGDVDVSVVEADAERPIEHD